VREAGLGPGSRLPAYCTATGKVLLANRQELAAALFAIAAPVHGEDRNVIATVSIAVHSAGTVIEELLDSVGPQLLNAAERISAQQRSTSGGEGERS
jgi:DNA-binding IclR family transcriptional regulator